MYSALLNQSLPAPYAMNTMPMQPQTSAYAHGGKIKRGKMVIAHMNPHELNVLDHIQGKIERCPKSGMRSYSHLEELLKNPHILAGVHHHARCHHAMGGDIYDYSNAHLNHLAAGGIHGDTELALIGPHTHDVFNQLADGATINPHDGHPQYWSLKNALTGIWNTVKSGASKVKEGASYALPIVARAAKDLIVHTLEDEDLQKALGKGFHSARESHKAGKIDLKGALKVGANRFVDVGGLGALTHAASDIMKNRRDEEALAIHKRRRDEAAALMRKRKDEAAALMRKRRDQALSHQRSKNNESWDNDEENEYEGIADMFK